MKRLGLARRIPLPVGGWKAALCGVRHYKEDVREAKPFLAVKAGHAIVTGRPEIRLIASTCGEEALRRTPLRSSG